MNPAQLKELTPGFFLGRLPEGARAADHGGYQRCPIRSFLPPSTKMVTEVPIADWKTYLRWHLISARRAESVIQI